MRKLTTDEFIIKSKSIHGETYDYCESKYNGNNKPIRIKCKIESHPAFYQLPSNHYAGKGCKLCANIVIGNKLRKDASTFIKQSNERYNNKYSYSSVQYKNWETSVCIICPEHGEFYQTPSNHLVGIVPCPECLLIHKSIITTKSNADFILDAISIHGVRYNYDLVSYKSSTDKVIILCQEHGEFKQTPNSHLNGSGCPTCCSSKGETNIRNILNSLDITFIEQHRFSDCRYTNPLSFDFYIPEIDVCIEYDGYQHFNPVTAWGGESELQCIQKRDKIKDKYCENNFIHLHRIKYTDDINESMNFLLKEYYEQYVIQPSQNY